MNTKEADADVYLELHRIMSEESKDKNPKPMKYIDADKLKAEIERQRKDAAMALQDSLEAKNIDAFMASGGICWACEQILSFIASLQQEQPEVDLGKFTEKIKTFQERYKYPEIVSIKGAMAFMARMFYQYPNVARQWYDVLLKATMDDARKEE